MKRRDFLMTSATAAVAARLAGGTAQAQAQSAGATGFEWTEATVAQLGDAMRSGQTSARALTQAYLDRIERLDRGSAALGAVLETNSQALAAAEQLDGERKAKGPRGPLHGIPVLIKDNIETGDRMSTSAGSLALEAYRAQRDATIVDRLRKAGAVILGKTNLSEWANFRSTHSVSGWSGRGGQTRNPYALDRNPCGSSSGTGAGISANLAAVGVGTETDGSIVCPASMCGLVGIKPTLGLVSRAGIIPLSHSQDTAGPMARTVRDAAILLGVLAGTDARDRATVEADAHAGDFTRYLDASGLKGARLGVARKFFGFNAALDQVMERALAELKRQGAILIDPADLPSHGKMSEPEFEVLLYEFKADLNAWLAQAGSPAGLTSLAALIEFNQKNRDREMPYFGQEILEMAEKKGPLTDKAYREALEKSWRLARQEGIDAVLAKFKVDAIVAPTAGPAWVIDWANGDHDTGGCSTPAAVAGYPHVTVPAGDVFGLPVGLSFFGGKWSEPVLLRLAYAFEQATKARRAPSLAASVRFA